MKAKYSLIAIFILILPVLSWTAPFHVIVDPGHGGPDTGAVRGKYKESELTLQIANELAARIRKDPDFRVTMTRDKDERISVASRTKLARDLNPDLFVSIHLNAAQESYIKGSEFYFQNQLPPEEETLYLADQENQESDENQSATSEKAPNTVNAILDDLKKTYQLVMSRQFAGDLSQLWAAEPPLTSTHIKQGPFQVIVNVKSPSLLLELGFLSNPKEAQWLSNHETHELLAQRIYLGIRHLKERMDKHRKSGHIAL